MHIVGVKLGKRVNMGGGRNVEISAEVFNLLNGGRYTEFSRQGANRIYNPQTFGTFTNPQTPRAMTLQTVVHF